jgi:enoyl-CoA hydratase
MASDEILIQKQDTVAVVSINRHERRNSLGAEALDQMDAAFAELEKDDAVRVVILTGAGGSAFCAGADLEQGFDASEDSVRDIVVRGQAVFQRIENFPKPVIAAVTGYAFGGGFELMLACDITIAEENVTMGQPEVTRGLIPGWGGTQKIPRMAGKQRAMEIMLLGARFRAPQALAMGLINQVAPRGQGLDAAMDLAKKLAKNPPAPMALIKDAVLRGAQLTLEQGLAVEADNFAAAFKQSEWNKS